jgi:hypothetical protein
MPNVPETVLPVSKKEALLSRKLRPFAEWSDFVVTSRQLLVLPEG